MPVGSATYFVMVNFRCFASLSMTDGSFFQGSHSYIRVPIRGWSVFHMFHGNIARMPVISQKSISAGYRCSP
jgi:hypothetical protein